MIDRVRFQKVAEVQIANGHNTYLLRSAHLAATFLEAVDKRLDELVDNPYSCQILFTDDGSRNCVNTEF